MSADRILMPAFSTMNVITMFDDMFDVTSQLILKWERYVCLWCTYLSLPHLSGELWEHRFGTSHSIDPAADFTRLTLDAISLCAMSYRFVIGLFPMWLSHFLMACTVQAEFVLQGKKIPLTDTERYLTSPYRRIFIRLRRRWWNSW